VKIFNCSPAPYDKIQFILSKHFGFIQLLPFGVFIYSQGLPKDHVFKLIGFKNDTIKKGYQQPQFKDYFHLHQGDILYWRITSEGFKPDPPSFYNETTYFIDSITSAIITDSIVSYAFLEKYIKSNGEWLIFKTKANYSKNEIGKILEYPTSWNYYPNIFTNSITLEIQGNDTVSSYSYREDYIDNATGARYSTKYGLAYTYSNFSYSGSTNVWEIIGSIINGKKEGSIPAFLSEGVYKTDEIKIYPNPSNGIFRINNLNIGSDLKIVIYDSMGRKVFERNNFSENSIDLSAFGDGIYFISITGSDINYSDKIILEK
jgi:hypothetical protein